MVEANPTTDERVTFRCQYPDNCNCCPSNVAAFVAVRADAERMQQEHEEDLDRMARATETIEALQAEITRLKAEHRKELNQTIRDAREDVAEAAANARLDALEESDHGYY